ncbi:MAG: site-specific integrase [Gammaproteobacteria bacterium]|nr:site-specific integrase [Gammaproteobacteria bacterium]
MAKGVEIRGGSIRVYFRFNGEKCRERLNMEPTPANVVYAERMVEQIKHEIKVGAFDYAKHFPGSSRLAENSLGHYLDLFLEIKSNKVAPSTWDLYRSIIETWLKPSFGARQANSIDSIELERWISQDLADLSSKYIKEVVAVLRQAFGVYRKRNPGALDPTEGIVVRLPDDDDPDPFTRAEIERLLNTPAAGGRIQELNLVEFMIWSGPRVSEALALAWEDVADLEAGVIQFRRAIVRGQYKATKTKRSKRQIQLLKPARDALVRQHKLTAGRAPILAQVLDRDNRTIKTERIRPVFLDSRTLEPHYSTKVLRESFFSRQCEAAEVRYRGPGQCRHTFASQLLTTGALPIEWIAQQMGHTSTDMLRRKYATWINEDAPDVAAVANKILGFE